LDLKHNAQHRVFWALWLCQWQGACRVGDFLRRNDERRPKRWNPDLDCHRGRLSARKAFTSEGKVLGIKMVIRMKPVKNDRHNVRLKEKSFVIDESEDALSAGAALVNMLRGDKNTIDNEKVPLFRDPVTNKEITTCQSRNFFKKMLRAAGLHELATGNHCLRIGGTSAVYMAKGGGEATAMRHGCWLSTAAYKYMWAGQGHIDEITTRIARTRNTPIDTSAGRLGK